MHILIRSDGSTGDVIPFVALAQQLQSHNHHVVFALEPHLAGLVERFGFEVVRVGPDLSDIFLELQKSELQEGMQRPGDQQSVERLWSAVYDTLPEFVSENTRLARKADLIISPPSMITQTAHELTGTPFVSVTLAHPSNVEESSIAIREAEILNQIRGDYGLAPSSPNSFVCASSQLALYAMSRHLYRLPAQSPAHAHVVGFFFLDTPDWTPDPALAQFLEQGAAPVVISFGSMVDDDAEQLATLLGEAIALAGCRAVIQQGWNGLTSTPELCRQIHTIDFVPHHWLFPQAALVVHHGGPGTAAAALRAGKPAIFVPQAWDQFAWSRLVFAQGAAGPEIIPYLELTAERLAGAIQITLTRQHYHASAAALGQRIREEQAVEQACRLIHQRFPKRR